MTKVRDMDPDFLKQLQDMKPLSHKHITVMETIKNSQLSDKIYMFKRVDETTDTLVSE